MTPEDREILRRFRAGLRRMAKIPPAERLRGLIERGVIDNRGRVRRRGPL